jgi:hypothetical protein
MDDATLEFLDFKRLVSEFEFTARKNRWANVKDNKMKEHKILMSKDRTYLIGNRAEDLMRPPPERVQPLCESCGPMLTIKHLLVECTIYDEHRVRLLGDHGLPSALAESEGSTKRTIEYFSEIDLFDEI